MSRESKKKWARGRKRRLMPKDNNAPKGPFTGYMMFVNDQREVMRQSDNKMDFTEFNKSMALKWAQVDPDVKKNYLEAAEADKARFEQEMVEYKKTEAYKKFMENLKKEESNEKKMKGMKTMEKNKEVVSSNGLEIPIFTEEFLNHNKSREGELRQLRKSITEYEEQNVILQKHIESMRTAVVKAESDIETQKKKNSSLVHHLKTIRGLLAQAFSGVAIPGSALKPSEDSIDGFLTELHSVLTSHPQQHNKLVQSVKQIVNNLANNL